MTRVLARRTVFLSRIRQRPTRRNEGRHCFSSLSKLEADPLLVDAQKAPASWQSSAAVVYHNAVTEEQASIISDEILGHRMRRRRYEKGHWDSVITGYRELELYDIHELVETMESESDPTIDASDVTANIANAFWKIRKHLQQNHATSPSTKWLPCHAIDLKQDGQLSAHVDSVRFSGHMVAGLSLLSPAIMRLKEDQESDEAFVDLYLPPRSLYVLTGVGRYEYSHELLPDGSTFCSPPGDPIVVPREQRLSIIFRDAKEEEEEK